MEVIISNFCNADIFSVNVWDSLITTIGNNKEINAIIGNAICTTNQCVYDYDNNLN